jgi:hypothetical protein
MPVTDERLADWAWCPIRGPNMSLNVQPNIIEQLKRAIEAYDGPLPAIGDSIQEVWFRNAVKQLIELERQKRIEALKADPADKLRKLKAVIASSPIIIPNRMLQA